MTEYRPHEYRNSISCAVWLQDVIPDILKREKCLTSEYCLPLPLSKTHTLFVALVTKNTVFDKSSVEFIGDSTLRITIDWESFRYFGFIVDFTRTYYHLPEFRRDANKDNPTTVKEVDVVDDIIDLFNAAHGLPFDFFDNDD